jgi:myo-inositol-1(or 4)-monophosphatase
MHTDNNSCNRELQAAVIFDPFRDECFSAMLGDGAKLNGLPIKVGEESTALEAVVVTGYAPADASTDVMLKGMTGKHIIARH